MLGLASCRLCGELLPGDDLLKVVLHDRLKAGAGVTEELFASAHRMAGDVREKARAGTISPEWRSRHSERAARHEAAHAVIALVVGAVVDGVDIDTSCLCRTGGRAATHELDATISLAGPAIDQRASGIRQRIPDHLLDFAIQAARAGRRDGCDACMTSRALVLAHPNGDDDTIKARFRDLLTETIRLLGREPVRSAIDRVVAALLEHGHLTGIEVTALVGPGIAAPTQGSCQ